MKTHPGALPNAPCKGQAHGNDVAEAQNSNPAEKNLEQQGEKEGVVPSLEKGDDPELQPTTVASSVTDEPPDTSG